MKKLCTRINNGVISEVLFTCQSMETLWEPPFALRKNNTDKVSQGIQYQAAVLFTTYSWGGASVRFINWWVGGFELPVEC